MTAKQSPYTASSQALQAQHDNSPMTLVKRNQVFLESRADKIARWVTQGVRPEALIRFVLMEMQTNNALASCTQESIYLGLLACAVTGLEPGALKGEAFLIPYGKVATFVPGWKGLVKQARRSRDIVGLTANVVRQGDVFDVDIGTANSIVHKPTFGERGDVIAAYAIATMASGHREIEVMDRSDLDRIKRVSGGRSPAWKDWEDMMQRKSAIRRLCKRLPLGADYFVALALEQAHDEGRDQRAVLDAVGEETVQAEPLAPSMELTDEDKAAIAADEAKS